MSSLIVGGLIVPIAPGSAHRDRLDGVDRSRAFDQTYRASVTGNPKRVWHFSTPPIHSGRAGIYEAKLTTIPAQVCSGTLLGGAENLVLQSENLGVTWTELGVLGLTIGAHTASGVSLDLVSDDNAALAEGVLQTLLVFTGNGTKGVSTHVKQGTSTDFAIRQRDSTASVNRLLVGMGWSAGLPVLVAATTGTYLGYEPLPDGVFRLLFSAVGVVAANANETRLYAAAPAALTAANVGDTYFGGVQIENSSTPGPYVKTTTATIDTLSVSCFSELTGRTQVRTGTGTAIVFDFTLEEA